MSAAQQKAISLPMLVLARHKSKEINMERSRKSARKNYRHPLASALKQFFRTPFLRTISLAICREGGSLCCWHVRHY